MKKFVFCLIVFFTGKGLLYGQIGTTLVVQPSPTAVLSEWATKNSIVNFIIDYGAPTSASIVFKTTLKLNDGTVVATTDVTRFSPLTISRGVRVFYSKDVMPLEIMIFSGNYKNTLDRTGKLPSGQYQLCVEILSPGNFQPLVAEKCKNFNVAAVQLPFLVAPADQSALPAVAAQTSITFRWTPVISQPGAVPPTYRLQVFEVLSGQRPVQALRSNQPILDISLRSITQYIWQPRLAFIDSLPYTFVWTIQTLDAVGQPLLQTDGNGESRSNPFVFKIRHDFKK